MKIRSKKFIVLMTSICLVLALSLVFLPGASAAPTADEVPTYTMTSADVGATRVAAAVEDPEYGRSCTAGIATGLTSLVGNMNAQTMDPGVHPDARWRGVTLVIPEEGNRYFVGRLNEKGVSVTGFFRPGLAAGFPPYPGTPEYVSTDELLRTCDSAAEFVEAMAANHAEYGTRGGTVGRMIVDTEEGYLVEGANIAYGTTENYHIHGPMTDQVFACANFFVSQRLKAEAEGGIGAGYTRAQRVWELLIDRQYDSITLQPNPPGYGSGISLPYFMSVWRDHGDISPEQQRISGYVPEERGEQVICSHGLLARTGRAMIMVSRPDYTHLFSSYWKTPNEPCISPYLPFYIGINRVPDIATGPGNALGEVFAELRLAVERHPEYRDEITRYWTIWEIQTIEESYGVERAAASLARAGDEAGARELLTEFVEKKASEALAIGEEMVEFLNGLPLFSGMLVAVAEAGPPFGVGPKDK